MKALKNSMRYELLLDQFKMYKSMNIPQAQELEASLKRLFSYVYECTDIFYLEFIDEKILYNYLKYHHTNHFQEISFTQCIKDIKCFLYFLEKVKGLKHLPKVDFSVNNLSFWENL